MKKSPSERSASLSNPNSDVHPKKPLSHAYACRFSSFCSVCNCAPTQFSGSPKSDQIGCVISVSFHVSLCQDVDISKRKPFSAYISS
jgi:hypothetical protein